MERARAAVMLTLPPLLTLETYDGDWDAYLRAVHAAFRRDFVDGALPLFRGVPMRLKRHPFVNGMEATFWHMISEGGGVDGEDGRSPDPRRCERICWPRPIIEAADGQDVRVWSTLRGSDIRVIVALPDFSYVVVVAVRKDYVLPWTAYTVEEGHRRRKLEREYRASSSATAQKGRDRHR